MTIYSDKLELARFRDKLVQLTSDDRKPPRDWLIVIFCLTLLAWAFHWPAFWGVFG